MGFYIETPGPKHKADYLLTHHEARLLFEPEFHHGVYTTVVVVDNGQFEAAGVVYDEAEFKRVSEPDGDAQVQVLGGPVALAQFLVKSLGQRPCIWLKVPTDAVKKLCPQVAQYL